ncbi:XRE family transcriptional regulator [Phyllobacterium myrsinacearum]|jgi:DNA-binding XRE family transcriptional regulator|uniref:XRE family transcriptional regulator n=1 Tax=Phyllobacteriaceae TaxID=69277 RepID=UPI0010E96142|nr:XRE family transcriptional regulator [Phyllobacterium myrsinacearum]RZS83924.1 helix-turn-helix protein [Phyllobacterium myrsinacearum]
MGRSLDEVIASLPRDQQEPIEAQYDELRQEVESLRELRQIAGKGQADIASALNIKQPSVSKIEKQTDMYLSTLRSYVEAVGGKLELTVRLPKRPALRIHHLGDQAATAVAKARVAGRGAASPARRRHG